MFYVLHFFVFVLKRPITVENTLVLLNLIHCKKEFGTSALCDVTEGMTLSDLKTVSVGVRANGCLSFHAAALR